ncbi:MAG: type II/IV secretion system protein [Pedobacter sp.]|nr:MAG: type II/IV secretion system protein [Pedobacter sp.]
MGELINQKTLHLIPKELAKNYRVVPKIEVAGILHMYCITGVDKQLLGDELETLLGRTVVLHDLPAEELERLLATHYLVASETVGSSDLVASFAVDENFLDALISEARDLKSSDIHIETYEQHCRIRVRIDGQMVERYSIGKNEYPSLVNKVKILASLDIAEKRLPQDGRINFRKGSVGAFDIRVSVLPTLHGEKVVLRLLSNSSTDVELDQLGLSDNDYANYMQGIKRPNGIILISGPTGSGKTTTLYATLKLLNKTTRNILTIEDPIEYTLEGVNQVQLRDSIGLGFASALRTFLRQDPDVIMVGEIRDPETANMAIRAALTGHLVLSTIHTNSAWGTVSRLMDMGIPGFLVANTLTTSVAQRLLRLLCPVCKLEVIFDSSAYPRSFNPPVKVSKQFISNGCATCFHTGYKGRRAVYEVLPIDKGLSAEIRLGTMDVSRLLKDRKISTLSENAFLLFSSGQTSLEEVYPLLLTN